VSGLQGPRRNRVWFRFDIVIIADLPAVTHSASTAFFILVVSILSNVRSCRVDSVDARTHGSPERGNLFLCWTEKLYTIASAVYGH